MSSSNIGESLISGTRVRSGQPRVDVLCPTSLALYISPESVRNFSDLLITIRWLFGCSLWFLRSVFALDFSRLGVLFSLAVLRKELLPAAYPEEGGGHGGHDSPPKHRD